MKNNCANQILRMQTIIENDRLNKGDGFGELLLADLTKLLLDYFDFNGSPEIEVQKNGGNYKVSIVIYPTRTKIFNRLR